MSRIRALVTPKLVAWARESVHLRPDEAASKIRVTVETLLSWESGSSRPTLPQARKAADVYGRPLAIFYLEDVPKDFALVHDFRRIADEVGRAVYSYHLTLLIREMQARQAWVRDMLRELNAPRLGFVNSVGLDDKPAEVAKAIRSKLGISMDEQLGWDSLNTALNAWSNRVESLGAFVSHTSARGKISVTDARGFALVDPFAPFVFVNAKDSLGGRIFSLAHEFTHVWLGESGVSGEQLSADITSHEGRVEQFCNAVAARVVFPDAALDHFFKDTTGEPKAIARINTVAREMCVSRDVVARRLLDANMLDNSTYESLHNQYVRDWRSKQDGGRGGGNYYVTHPRALGKAFVRFVADVYSRGRITGVEAASLMQAKLDKMSRLVEMATVETL